MNFKVHTLLYHNSFDLGLEEAQDLIKEKKIIPDYIITEEIPV